MEPRQILKESNELEEQLVAWRRDFHRNPELGFEEQRTSEIVTQHLRDLGMEVQAGVAETGVVGLLEGEIEGPTVLLRFDMDALPIQEKNEIAYASTKPGVMHACGHDGHTAIGMGVASLLQAQKAVLPGKVKFVFQPAEEGLGGALRMVQEGVLEHPVPSCSLALHLWNTEPVGWFGVVPGPVMAGSEILEMTVRGRGGHGAAPHQTADPILATAQIISALQSVVSRNVDPLEQAVVSITWINAGDAHNIIPEEAFVRGTIRTFKEETRLQVLSRIEEISTSIASGLGCVAEVSITKLTPPVENDRKLTRTALEVVKALYPNSEIDQEQRTMGSEDMAYLMESVPGFYLFLGSNNVQEGLDAAHHSPYFNFDEKALPVGVALLSGVALRMLSQYSEPA
jgi:amidohydrolase